MAASTQSRNEKNELQQQSQPFRSGGQYGDSVRPFEDTLQYCRQYVREQPEAAAMWCFGIGFVLGWKLKPW